MTEQASETQLIEAASTGAAAAVAAVADDQAEQQRAEEVADSAAMATGAAELAAESATIAVEASTEASGVAYQAAEQATVASDVASAAAEAAYDARAEIAAMRAEYAEQKQALLAAIEELRPKQTAEPTEVVVSTQDDTRPDTPAEQSRDHTGSSGSHGNTRRHKFGRR